MTKRSQPKVQTRRNFYVAVALGLVAILAVVFFATRGVTDALQGLTPTNYQSQFIASNTAHFLVDVRTPEEFSSGHIRGAVNIPVESLADRLSEVPSDQPIVVYCRSGNRSAQASQILSENGYTQIYDMGGLNDWVAQGYPVE